MAWAGALAMTGTIAAAAPATSAPAAETAASAQAATWCFTYASGIDSSGSPNHHELTASSPPTDEIGTAGPVGYWATRMPRLSTPDTFDGLNNGQTSHWSYVVAGDNLYFSSYNTGSGNVLVREPWETGPTPFLKRIGGGWSTMRAIEHSDLDLGADSGVYRDTVYALTADGTLLRWQIGETLLAFGSKQSFAGFGPVKTMTLISQTSTYDTLLMNTIGGALYTVRIPVSTPMKPVVKIVRSTSWNSFDTLLATRCGQHGTLLTAIDTDTQEAHLFAVGHANGTNTVIQTIGKSPKPFTGTAIHEVKGEAFYGPPHVGE